MFSVFLSSIGVNLCQSVDGNAESAKKKILCSLWFPPSILLSVLNLCIFVDTHSRIGAEMGKPIPKGGLIPFRNPTQASKFEGIGHFAFHHGGD